MNVSFASQPTINYNPYAPVDLFRVDGLVVVITGGGTGIGLTMASALESNGAIVYIVGRRLAILEEAARTRSKFGNIIPLQGDVTDRSSLLSVVEAVKARHGYIDLLVNNAGIAKNLYSHPLPTPHGNDMDRPPSPADSSDECGPSIPSIKSFQSALWNTGSPEDFAQVFATNVTAPYYTTIAFLDLLHQGNVRQQVNNLPTTFSRPPYHSSQVLTVSSSGAFRIDPKVLSMSYTLSKAACNHLGQVMANLLVPWGIRSNIIAPGVWPSEMTNSAVADGSFSLTPSMLSRDVPAKRVGTEEDMAGAILYLASRAGAYMNGSVFVTDGGRSNAYLGGGAACQF